MSFPLHIRRIILFFVYSGDHQHSFVYPYLEEEGFHSSCVVYVDHVFASQPIEKDEFHISIPHEIEHPYSHGNHEADLPYKVFVIPFHQLVKPRFQPIFGQTRIREKMFKYLRLPSHLHPYPLYFFEYLPHFSGEDHITAEKNLGSFENFVDQFEIVYEYVTMRLFSKSLFGDVSLWFKGLGVDSIGSWIELYNEFLRYWGENKSLSTLNRLFCSEEKRR